MKKKLLSLGVVGSFLAAIIAPVAVLAATTTVTPTNTQGWRTADTRPGGAVTFVNDMTSPAAPGALKLTTNDTDAAKAQYTHAAPLTPLSQVTDLSYYTKQVAGPAHADPSYQLEICLTGFNTNTAKCNDNATSVGTNPNSYTNLVYEPYQKDGNGTTNPVVANDWQKWDAAAGQWWSSRTANCGNADGQSVQAGAGGTYFYKLADLAAKCPNAVVEAYGVNIGSYNPGYNVETDLLTYNGTTYNFDTANLAASKEDCKKDNYKNYTDAQGNAFKNQGDCVSYYSNAKTTTTTLNSNNPNGTDIPTVSGSTYKVAISGTWTNRNGGDTADAECIKWAGDSNFTNESHTEGGTTYSPNLLDVQVKQTFIDWGTCQPQSHTYTTWVTGDGNPINLRVFDGDTNTSQQIASWFTDNNGSLNVTVVAYPANGGNGTQSNIPTF